MAYITRNIDNASQLKFWPGIVFSPELEEYVNKLAEVHSMHPDSLALALINVTAATLEFSYVLRANSLEQKMQTNLFNMIVARSSYGKSEITRIIRDMLKTIVIHRPNKFRTPDQVAAGYDVNPTLDEMSKAGLMSALDCCCRTVVCDEADITFSDCGVFVPVNTSRTVAEMNCRVLITSFFDRISHPYIRQLAHRTVSVTKSKLNIIGCTTGDIISNMIIRMKTDQPYDSTIGRFLFWPLDGPVIPDKIIQKKIDYNSMASLNQFVIILSYLENVIFQFEDDALDTIVSWGFDIRTTNECLSALLGKSVQHVYRMVTFLQAIELAFTIFKKYLEIHHSFPVTGAIDNSFTITIEGLFHSTFPLQFTPHGPEPFRISNDVTLRGIDLISCNTRQFQLLFDSTHAPKFSSIGRQLIVVQSDQQQIALTNQPSSDNEQLKHKKQHQRYMLNFDKIAMAVILFESICFTTTQLHKSTFIHNNSGGGLLKDVLKKLIQCDILTVCSRGVKTFSRSTAVYIKQIPLENDIDAEQEFLRILSEFTCDKKSVSIDMYRRSCELMVLDAVGVVQGDVYEILRRPEYGDRDLKSLTLLPKTSDSKASSSSNSVPGDADDLIVTGDGFEQNIMDAQSDQGDQSVIHPVQQFIDHNCQQTKSTSNNSSTVPVNSISIIDDMPFVALQNTELLDARASGDIINENDKVELDISFGSSVTTNNTGKDLLHTDPGHVDENLNDGFISPTAWKTRSRAKDFTKKDMTKNNYHSNYVQSTSEPLTTTSTKSPKNCSLTNFSSSPPSHRTRAHLKRKKKEDPDAAEVDIVIKKKIKK